MALSKTHESILSKLYLVGNSELGVALDDEICAYLIAVIARDLGISKKFPELTKKVPEFFGKSRLVDLRVPEVPFRPLFERLITLVPDADTYFFCLATLHKARLKYERILQAQAIPTIDQVGPRGLLQYGSLSARALAAFLFWRKWIYDIDNRAAQESGYVFEPIMAHAIGGTAASGAKSPIRRGGKGDGRQVDCVRESDKRAYEFKLRVTIASSGQGRWREEIEFPFDCRASGYSPVLIVLDPTENPKLTELTKAFLDANGEVFVGPDAWKHLESTAGRTMARFIDRYVHAPVQSLLKEVPVELPDISFSMKGGILTVEVAGDKLVMERVKKPYVTSPPDALPEDVDEDLSLA